MTVTFSYCPDCDSEHMGSRCGLTFLQRMRGIAIPASATPTRTLRRYYDPAPLEEATGQSARERKEKYLDATKGIGSLKRDAEGRFWKEDRSLGGFEPASGADLDFFAGSDIERPGSR